MVAQKRRKRIKCRMEKTLEVNGAGNWRGTVQASLQIHWSGEEIHWLLHFEHIEYMKCTAIEGCRIGMVVAFSSQP